MVSGPPNRILILFAHPRFEQSRVNRALIQAAGTLPTVTLRDLYELYPDFNIDVEREQKLLAAHEILVWQFPFYLYGAPALLKQWLDLVLVFGWAHGPGGEALQGKIVFSAVTTGGTRLSYGPGGYNRFPLGDLLLPFAQTAALCRMTFLPPFAVQGTYRLTTEQLAGEAGRYRTLLEGLAGGGFDTASLQRLTLLNDALAAEGGEEGP